MEISILIVSGILGVMGFVMLLEDIAARKGWKEYGADICIFLAGSVAFTAEMVIYVAK